MQLLASPKAVTLTNSRPHNGTLAQFVFCFYYGTATKAAKAWQRPVKFATATEAQKAPFLCFQKDQTCSFFRIPPSLSSIPHGLMVEMMCLMCGVSGWV